MRRIASMLTIGLAACGPAPVGPATNAMLDAVNASTIRAHVETLAADDMRGREAGTDAYLEAARYVASRFAEFGLRSFDGERTYLQEISFFETRLEPGSATLVLHRADRDTSLSFSEDFVMDGGFGAPVESLTAPLVFVGFGIRAPEYDHDDFSKLDVSGKILVQLSGAPPHFATDERAYYSSRTVKQALAVEHGAAGVLTVRTPVDRQRTPWQRVVAGIGSADMNWLTPAGEPFEAFPELVNASLSESGAKRLFELAGRDLDALFEYHGGGGRGGFDLDLSITLSRRSQQGRAVSPNVLGLLEGRDPALRDEYLIYTAHLDHLGIRAAVDGDDIYNGAYDNATGIALLLEVARIMATTGERPRRSIVFAAVTAEEKGLQGSSYLSQNFPLPIANAVANINIDMPYLGFPIADVEAYGAEHSTLHAALTRAVDHLDLQLTPDPRPDLVRFIRSDQFSFVKQGVPALALKPGSKSSDPAIDGAALHEAFLKDHYHQPSDDLGLPFNAAAGERFARAALLLGLIVANDDQRPRWNEGDFFGERFKKE